MRFRGFSPLKSVVEMGVSALVLQIVLNPLRHRLKAAPANPVVAEATRLTENRQQARGRAPCKARHPKLDIQSVSRWAEVTPEQALLLLRALKLHEVDGRWLLETNRAALDLALSVTRKG
jgi:hypothetical protein